tara:strand:+ start:231 stop:1184 length:954 start_codon:yes stop_codon:yes gene_type:complete
VIKILNKISKLINNIRLKRYKSEFKKLLNNKKIKFIDIGASIQIIPRWKRIDKSNLDYVLFEPNQDEAKKLLKNKKHYNSYKIYESGLGEKNKVLKLNITEGIYQTSVLKPNFYFLNQFLNPGRYKIIKKELIQVKKLDYFRIINSDFIKVDAQGYNYEILEGSVKTLKDTLGIEAELEFTDIYSKQKLFGDVTKLLKKNNLNFIDFTTLRRWNRYDNSNYGQCVFGNGLFLKDPDKVLSMSKDKIFKYIAICILYKKFDLVKYILKSKKINTIERNLINKNLKFFNKFSNKSRVARGILSVMNRFFDFESEVHLFE